MSNMGSKLDIQYPSNLPVPTYYTNYAQLSMVGDDEVCMSFCIRSPEKPALQANLQCRIITSVPNLKRLNQGLAQLLSQHDQQMRAIAEREKADAQRAPHS